MASRTMAKKKIQMYNAQGTEAEKAAKDEEPGFKKGGRTKKKDGGALAGEASAMRADRKPRHKRAAGGRTPYSTGAKETSGMDDSKGAGHESERPPMSGV